MPEAEAKPDNGPPKSATGMLPDSTQLLIRMERLEGRMGTLEEMMGRVIEALEGRTRLSEKCIDMATAFVTGPNVKWLALVLIGLAAIANGVVMSGYGLSLGGKASAVEEGP